jgi:nicotinamide phosphoribosyltransferase
MKILPILLSDSYKQFHWMMYPKGITKLYSNFTPRSFKHLKTDNAVWFGLQYYLKEYLLDQWQENFFNRPVEEVVNEYKRFHKNFSFYDMPVDHIANLHKLGYLPIKIKALPEGVKVKEKVPFFTITNTHKDFAWLVNFLETQMSTCIWDMCVNATIAHEYRKILDRWADKTCNDRSFVQWQGHDFAQRGRSSTESTFNQMGHLLSFTGTDTIPSVLAAEYYYNADMEKELIASSVPATEHSIMTSYGKENEIEGFERMLDLFPTGIVSIVSDSFDLWQVCTTFVTQLKDKILARDGKLVIRPDSGDPVDIVCGMNTNPDFDKHSNVYTKEQNKGVIELLWDVFGGTVNSKGYKVLDSHIGAIYGDSISRERAEAICERLASKGFASNNVVFGIGSYTYNYNTRDSLGIAVKSTYCEVDGVPRNIFKDPVTDDGMKRSARGLLKVELVGGEYVLKDEVSPEEENGGELVTVYENGKLLVDHSLQEIRNRLNG